MKIVVVDDDKIIRLGLTKIIKRLFEQHEVISDFNNGAVALEYLRDNKVDFPLPLTPFKITQDDFFIFKFISFKA